MTNTVQEHYNALTMITKKQAQLVKLKAKGLTSQQIADEVGLKSAVDVRVRLNKPNVKEALYKEMKAQGLTLDKIVKPVKLALEAKTKHKIGEVITERDENGKATQIEYIYADEDNIPLQLQGSDRAAKWLGLDSNDNPDNSPSGVSKEDIEQLAGEADEVVLTQLLFRKG